MTEVKLPHWNGTMEGSGEAAWNEVTVRDLVRHIEIWRTAHGEEARKFQAETLRTSELSLGILELCSLLEKAEDALEVMARTTSCNYAGVPEALAAIKQWKEQT